MERWSLARAGIINVYQYGNETLHFGGGRLLLRGVNGSGKSTAMNMLLPFLLDADTRRIDASGEQSGVLRSWMLAGRDVPQPVGYLWLELERGDEHLTCGCGIRANRSTDSVTTWWFVTTRRPGIDLDLVENRTPLSPDALRSALGGDPVYRHDQRGAYRDEVRSRLFGGADIDQHVRLLHVVRNPRVGDRIDVELAQYLSEALPQLSDAALDDAAQPLDDLEEHRRNVEDLGRTSTALGAVLAVYTSYARGDLRQRAGAARRLVADAEEARRALAAAERSVADAEVSLADAARRVEELEGDERRYREELDGLRASPAYRDARELTDLRNHLVTLATAIGRAVAQVDRQAASAHRARQALAEAGQAATEDAGALAGALRDLGNCAAAAGLPVGAPDPPALATDLAVDPAAPAGSGAERPTVAIPTGPLDPGPTSRALATLRSAVSHRAGDLADVREALAEVEAAGQRLDEARRGWEAATVELSTRQEELAVARRALDEAVGTWRGALTAWVEQLVTHRRAAGMAVVPLPDLGTELIARRDDVSAALAELADRTVAVHLEARATVAARRAAEGDTLDELAALVADLEGRTLPPAPAAPWQRAERGLVFAELIDFHDSVAAEDRVGVEAAMEAAGLLGAEVTEDGTLELAEGGLVVRAGEPAAQPLGRLLSVAVPDGADGQVDGAAIARLLDSISTDPAALQTHHEATVVTVDGRFRLGALRGRHAKPEVEHIGTSARRAALERQRADARRRHAEAQAVLEHTDFELQSLGARIEAARSLRAELPSSTPVVEKFWAVSVADDLWSGASRLEDERRRTHRRADEMHAEAADKSRRIAANLRLPTDPDGLRRVDDALREATGLARRSDEVLAALRRGVQRWQHAAAAWSAELADERQARAAHAQAVAEHQPVAARLATLEDAMGIAYDEILASVATSEADLERVTGELGPARTGHRTRQGALTARRQVVGECARRQADAAARAVATLPHLRRALRVPGLLDAALAQEPTSDSGSLEGSPAGTALFAPVTETPAGVGALAHAVETHVPAADRADVTADSVRQSLRQRRDTLGSGWDAEDRQADESLPVAIEVNGPQGRMPLAQAAGVVATRLRQSGALLSREQDDALRNLLQGLVAREVAEKLRAAGDLVTLMNRRLDSVSTAHGIGVQLRWRRRDGLDAAITPMIDLLARPPDLRTAEQEDGLRAAVSARLDEARRDDPEAPYRDLIARVLDYRSWHELRIVLRRPGRPDERLTRRTALSEGEKKIVSYLPLFAAVAASCDSLAEAEPGVPRFVLLDDAFAKVSEDNHAKLFGLLVELDLDFIATSERLWGTHATVPELAITEVIRDSELGVIVLEHSRWDGRARVECG